MLPVTGPSRRYPRRYRDGCPAPECDRSWCGCRRKSWLYAAVGKRPGIPGRGPPPVPGPALNGRPRSRHLPGRSPVGPAAPRSPRRPVAAPVLAGAARRSPWLEALMALRSSNRARLTPAYVRSMYFPPDAAGPPGARRGRRPGLLCPRGDRTGAPAGGARRALRRAAQAPRLPARRAGFSFRGLPFTETVFFRCEPFRAARREAGQMPGNVHVT